MKNRKPSFYFNFFLLAALIAYLIAVAGIVFAFKDADAQNEKALSPVQVTATYYPNYGTPMTLNGKLFEFVHGGDLIIIRFGGDGIFKGGFDP